ncbi:MAG: hypothetical protein ACREV5_17090, partial [Steroidobacter sp.]
GEERAKGGGGGAQGGHQAQYDPAQAADILKSRFVDRSRVLGVDMLSGGVTTTSSASLSVGNGGFPYELSANLTWTGGNVRSTALGPVTHTEPQQPWTTNWNNALTLSGSGLEVMGDGDIRATAGTIAAFLAAQDIYTSSDVLRRDVAGVLAIAWWVRQLAGNVATVNVGADTRQFVKILNPASTTQDMWIATGAGPHATLTQSASRTIYEEPSCGGGDVTYVLTRGWSNTGVTFQVTNAHGDVQTFSPWTHDFDNGDTYCAKLRGWRMASWSFPQGVTINLTYSTSTAVGSVPELAEVSNTLGRRIVFVDSGRGGFNNGLSGVDLRSVSVTGDATMAGTVTHTEPGGGVNQFTQTVAGQKYLLTHIYNAESASAAAIRYDYDTLRRVKEARDAVALQGPDPRGPYQFFLADGVRGERVDPSGGTYTVFYNNRKRAIGFMDEIGRTTSATYDVRGRVTSYIYPEDDREVFKYDARNNTIEMAKWPKGCTAEPCTPAALTVKAGWHTAWNKPLWIDDAKNNRTNFAYYESGNGRSLLQTATRPEPTTGASRPAYGFAYNGRGQLLTTNDPTGLVVSNVYHATTFNLQSTALNPGGVNAVTQYGYDAIGNVTSTTDPRLYVTEFAYDNNRRKTHTKSHNGNIAAALIAASKAKYDALGRVENEEAGTAFSGTSVTAWQRLKTITYTKTSKIYTEANGANNTTAYAYDAMDRAFQITDPVNRRTRFDYDSAGQVLKEIRAYGTALQQDYATYTYTLNGQRRTVKDANNNLSTFEYDEFDRLFNLRFPMATKGANQSSTTDYEQYGYDNNGNRASLRKRDGRIIAFGYDNLNRETLKDLPDTTTQDVYSAYDAAGRPESKRFGSTSGQGIIYAYDTAKRLQTESSFGRTLTYNYDANSNRNYVQWPDTSYVS